MNNYFPYSHIIGNIYSNLKKAINRHSFIGDWQILGNSSSNTSTENFSGMTEIYY